MEKEQILENVFWLVIICVVIGLFVWLGIVNATCMLVSLFVLAKILEMFSD